MANSSSPSLLKCTWNRASNDDWFASTLVDFYISQSFMKGCLGNLELLAVSIRRLLKYDCERAHKFKIAYLTSKYLNMFRTCDPNLTVGELMLNESVSKCSNKALNGTINRKYCSWYELVCKYPDKCFNSSTSTSTSTSDDIVDSNLVEQNLTNSSFS